VNTYIALLRGINVGGNALMKMTDLTAALTAAGLEGIQTYIQSGNVIFSSSENQTDQLSAHIQATILSAFGFTVPVVVFSREHWRTVIQAAPDWWGRDKTWKHNLLITLPPTDTAAALAAIGELKLDIEKIQPGPGVIYQSTSLQLLGRITTGKLASNPIYRRLTIRNFNTATKLLALLDQNAASDIASSSTASPRPGA
jgi:uncharacterized protein (DUF1697 family)